MITCIHIIVLCLTVN